MVRWVKMIVSSLGCTPVMGFRRIVCLGWLVHVVLLAVANCVDREESIVNARRLEASACAERGAGWIAPLDSFIAAV